MPTKTFSRSPRRSINALDRLNVILGDGRDAFEPYLAISLATERHWNTAQVGSAIAVTNMAGIPTQTPIGALVDAARNEEEVKNERDVTLLSRQILVHWNQQQREHSWNGK